MRRGTIKGLSEAVEMVKKVSQVFTLGAGVDVFDCNREDGPAGCPVISCVEYAVCKGS